ncbi:MAG: hypothetical protein JWR23_2159 [Mucilaginibacter sp.]|nr:hypothetical protein [Mucilaginibacter sp.]
MTPRSFWTILIKLLGIYIILQSLIAIPQFLGIYMFSLPRLICRVVTLFYLLKVLII